MKSGGRCLLAALWLCACSRSGNQAEAPAPRGSVVLASAPKPVVKPANGSKPPTAPAAKPKAAPTDETAKEQPKLIEQDALKTEEPEANPYSESVNLKLSVTPRVNALVLWGAKQMAHLEAGKMDTEITRPRGSGPLDLEIKAEGYMPYHTRLYADRNDKIGIRLYRLEEAPSLFGYKRSVEKSK
jgi:hypothetical protein